MGGLIPIGIALFALLALGPLFALLVRLRARRPGSTAWRVMQAGLKALPGIGAMGVGAVFAAVGLAYFGFLFLYWLFDTILQTIWVALVNGFTGHHDAVHYGSIYGQVALQGGLFLVGGILLVMLGVTLVAVVGGFAATHAAAPDPGPLASQDLSP
jgi:hypothetical protein